jgi:hypothetical protein
MTMDSGFIKAEILDDAQIVRIIRKFKYGPDEVWYVRWEGSGHLLSIHEGDLTSLAHHIPLCTALRAT